MKKSILTAFILALSVTGLVAQNKKGDSAVKVVSKPTPHTLTHKDSVLIQRHTKEAQDSPVEPSLPVNNGRYRVNSGINDVIDVEHEIK